MSLFDSGCSHRGISSRKWRGLRAYLVVVGGVILPMLTKAKSKDASYVELDFEPPTATAPSIKRTSGEVVPKTVFSSKLRMSILVGLEGTGHHYLMAAVENMFKSNDEISVKTTPCVNNEAYFTMRSMESAPSVFNNVLSRARSEMHDLALREQNLLWPGHLVRLCEEESFPSGNGAQKSLHYIDLRLLAEVAEEQGVDLRVLYLKRSAHDILIANTVHRPFHKHLRSHYTKYSVRGLFTEYVLMLLTDAAVMHAFLTEIDPAFIVCHDYARSGEEEQAWRVANFIAPSPEMAKMYATSLLDSWKEHASEREELPIESAKAVADRLQRELDSFESSFCG